LDHILILSEKHVRRVIREYSEFFNQARPHQGIDQQIPTPVLAELHVRSDFSPERRSSTIPPGLQSNEKKVKDASVVAGQYQA
jgi:hypothetical protein